MSGGQARETFARRPLTIADGTGRAAIARLVASPLRPGTLT
jgi:hypothetical protein